MNKLPVLALFSLLFVASVSSFPLSESTLEDLASDSDYHHHHHNEHFVDTTEDFSGDEDEDFDFDDGLDNDFSNNKIEDFVLGQPEPKKVFSGACYQSCKKGTNPKCLNTTPDIIRNNFVMADRNYCVNQCSVVNTLCFRT